jgi:hypothetical protein
MNWLSWCGASLRTNKASGNEITLGGSNGYEITQNGMVISLSSIDTGTLNSYSRVVNAGTFAVPPVYTADV